jgi:N-acetylmuramic acid 6-phosphate etherase
MNQEDQTVAVSVQSALPQITSAIEAVVQVMKKGRRELAHIVTSKAASGSTQYVIGALQEANQIGALTVALSCNRDTPISAEPNYPIEFPVGPEIVTGSTRKIKFVSGK